MQLTHNYAINERISYSFCLYLWSHSSKDLFPKSKSYRIDDYK